jgi:hypothetical protein
MITDTKVLIVIIISTITLESTGLALIRLGKITSRHIYRDIGIFNCLIAPIILIIGIIGLNI